MQAVYVALDINWGKPGDTNCGDSIQCSLTNNITVPHLRDNWMAKNNAIMYGNVFTDQLKAPVPMMNFNSQNNVECNGDYGAGFNCTNMADHLGYWLFIQQHRRPAASGFLDGEPERFWVVGDTADLRRQSPDVCEQYLLD